MRMVIALKRRVFVLSDIIGGLIGVSFIALAAMAGIGWVANIVKIFMTINDAITGMFIARVFGVFFFPVGCILGWL